MRIIDRYLLRQFLHTFVICFLSLTGLYIVFDAFTNLEAFMHCAKGSQLLRADRPAITPSSRSCSSIAPAACWR